MKRTTVERGSSLEENRNSTDLLIGDVSDSPTGSLCLVSCCNPVTTLTVMIMTAATLSWSSCFAEIIPLDAQIYEEGTLTVLIYR